jgi:hypothetical protein
VNVFSETKRPIALPEWFRSTGRTPAVRRLARWYKAPWWVLSLLTGAKSFVDNPILGSRRLNAAGLHVWRLKTAHKFADRRRAKLAKLLPLDLKDQFDRNGFIVIPDFLAEDDFRAVQTALLDTSFECRDHQQGDTITRRVAIGPELRGRIPKLDALFSDARWKGIIAYVSSTLGEPLCYAQSVAGGAAEGAPDPQHQLHSDTFHPSLKAWLFLTEVPPDGRPLTYVAGSHRLSPARIEWERRKSIEVVEAGDRLSQRGSLRIATQELAELGLPLPTAFAVPANTLVAIDTCGFHARADSDRQTVRAELWAFARRSPFIPWTSGGLLSWHPIAARQTQWIGPIVDWLDRRGWKRQHWRPVGRRRLQDF